MNSQTLLRIFQILPKNLIALALTVTIASMALFPHSAIAAGGAQGKKVQGQAKAKKALTKEQLIALKKKRRNAKKRAAAKSRKKNKANAQAKNTSKNRAASTKKRAANVKKRAANAKIRAANTKQKAARTRAANAKKRTANAKTRAANANKRAAAKTRASNAKKRAVNAKTRAANAKIRTANAKKRATAKKRNIAKVRANKATKNKPTRKQTAAKRKIRNKNIAKARARKAAKQRQIAKNRSNQRIKSRPQDDIGGTIANLTVGLILEAIIDENSEPDYRPNRYRDHKRRGSARQPLYDQRRSSDYYNDEFNSSNYDDYANEPRRHPRVEHKRQRAQPSRRHSQPRQLSGSSHVQRQDIQETDTPKVITYGETASLEPWSAGWQSYCSGKYRSFNPNSGTFLGYDGDRHFCVAR